MGDEAQGALALDATTSSFVIHTFAEGLFSRLAHDLEIRADSVTGSATDAGDSAGRATIEAPLSGLRVAGAVKKGKVDGAVLSSGDRADIEAKVRGEVLAGSPVVRVEAELTNGRAQLVVTAARNGRASVACDVTLRRDGDAVEASGRCDLSLNALGIAPVKGPLGAFRLSDRIEVVFRATFRPAR